MSKLKVDTILDEYREKLEQSQGKLIGAPYKKNKPLSPGAAVDLAFQAIEHLNKRLKALEKKGGVDTSEAEEEAPE